MIYDHIPTMEDITSEALPDVSADVQTAGGEETASKGDESLASILSRELGKNFKDNDSAIKAIKDTFNYVGKAGGILKQNEELKSKLSMLDQQTTQQGQTSAQTVQPQNTPAPQDSVTKELMDKIDKLDFYDANPDLKEHSNVIEGLAKETGKKRSELLQSDTFKTLIEKAKSFDAQERSKSVLTSNPRLGQIKDKISEAREIAKDNPSQAQNAAIGAVMDAFELR